MGGLQVKNLCQKKGRYYYRRKVKGEDQYIRLPAPWEPDHARAYNEAASEGERDKPAQGSLAALVAAYRASPAYKLIPSDKTRANYSRYLDMIVENDGHRSVKGIRVSHIYSMRDKMGDSPGKANNWLTVFRNLMIYAAKHDWRPDNPALGITGLPIGEYQPWPADVLTKALAAAPPMTRLIIITGLCSGARIGDCIRMQHGWHSGGVMEFVASKNKTDVVVPMHQLWLEEIAKVEKRAVTILYNRYGTPFKDPRPIEERIRDLMVSIGEKRQFVFHGLRKNAACYLYETGLSEEQIGAMLAMTPETVRHYTKRKRAYMLMQKVAYQVVRGDVLQLKGGRRGEGV